MTRSRWMERAALAGAALLLLNARPAAGHCDGMDGPVVKAAQVALKTGNVNAVLIWVQENDEAEIRDVFKRVLAVRTLGAEAERLADRYFFETLVRVHRTGEGAPYTGLKPAGRDLGPAIPAADKAVEAGAVDPLVNLVVTAAERDIRERFAYLMHAKRFANGDVKAGREYVKTYVEFVHYVERLYDAVRSPVHGHAADKTVRE